MTAAAQLLESPQPNHHLVQLYAEPDELLTVNVARYVGEGLRQGDTVLVIATAAHLEHFLRKLDLDGACPTEALRQAQLSVLDAEATLNKFMVDGLPDWRRFELSVGSSVARLRARAGNGSVRAYGEMVGLLWSAGQRDAAIMLESYWNRLLGSQSFSLYCAYPIDIFGHDFQVATVDAIFCAHSHLLPSGPQVEAALERAMKDVLGPRLEGLRPLIKANYRPTWATLPPVEAVILWLRNNLRGSADEILTRAGRYYRSSSLPRSTYGEMLDANGHGR